MENTERIKLSDPLADTLFGDIANDFAKNIAEADERANSSSQLRKFYDEIVMWQEKVGLDDTLFIQNLPFIMMLKAKVTYAQGRKHVTSEFTKLLSHILDEVRKINTAKALLHAKLFFEAFLGFYKVYRPK